MRELPSFLRRPIEDVVEKDPYWIEFDNLVKQYRERFPDSILMTEAYDTDMLIELLKKCLKKNIDIWELTGDVFDPENDY